ncbi:glutamate decarboxylase [Lasiosphaeria ovina]|uniref:Glutamate decarboxylase n=1 Tax=Lasiosphaeria ovina TaxID=92902 RepID=A0AAE0TYG6_9PEZI|nr:glutamate decarboxylase [Lasiosphaeria ovina]
MFSTVIDPSAARYGFAAQPQLPKNEMPEAEMPEEIVSRLIKVKLKLDGDLSRNISSFDATTFADEEAEKLVAESSAKNDINSPGVADIQSRCVCMMGRLFHAPESALGSCVGISCGGTSEAIMLAVVAMKKRWRNHRLATGRSPDRPNIIMSSATQVGWRKAARYFEIEEKLVYCTHERYTMDPTDAVAMVDENIIGICVILGTEYTGEYEDVKAVNDYLVKTASTVPIHVDAAIGAFVVPFVDPAFEWDFRLERVASINVSSHRYGFVSSCVDWVIWRSREYVPQELDFNNDFFDTNRASFTLNNSTSASHIVGQYYQLVRRGKKGYRTVMSFLTKMADSLSDCLEMLGFIIMSKKSGLGVPVVAFRLPPDQERHYDEFSVADQLRGRGWVVPAFNMAPHAANLKLLRVVVREDFTLDSCRQFLADIKHSVSVLDQLMPVRALVSKPTRKRTQVGGLGTGSREEHVLTTLRRMQGPSSGLSELIASKVAVSTVIRRPRSRSRFLTLAAVLRQSTSTSCQAMRTVSSAAGTTSLAACLHP